MWRSAGREEEPRPSSIILMVNLRVLRWDNDQYDELCGYRVAYSDTKNSRVLAQLEWPASRFPRSDRYHYLVVWLEGIPDHSDIVLAVSAHSAQRHGSPRHIHLAGWYEVETRVGAAAGHDPRAPVFRVSAAPGEPGIDIFEHKGVLTERVNCSVEELQVSTYSRVRELRGGHWREMPHRQVQNQAIGGQRLPTTYPARVDEMVLDVPADNPELWFRLEPA